MTGKPLCPDKKNYNKLVEILYGKEVQGTDAEQRIAIQGGEGDSNEREGDKMPGGLDKPQENPGI